MESIGISKMAEFFEGTLEEIVPVDVGSLESELSEEIFACLIVTEDTGVRVYDVRSASNHFALKSYLGLSYNNLHNILSAVAACLPSIVRPDGSQIPTDAKPSEQNTWITATRHVEAH